MTGLTFNYDVFGPGLNQGLYPSDPVTRTTFNDVTITNSLFLDTASHNIITENPVTRLGISDDTIFATQGGIEIPGNGRNTMTDVIKYARCCRCQVAPGTTSGDVWSQGYPLPGHPRTLTLASPRFHRTLPA